MKTIIYITAALMITSCNYFSTSEDDTKVTGKERKLPADMVYSYECLKADSGAISEAWEKADDIIGKVATFNIKVTDQEQMEFGEQFMNEGIENKSLVIDSADAVNATLDSILTSLLKKRVKPTSIAYQIYLLNDTATVNAYTVGGKIFITKAMLKKCTSNDQLYAIIGHEIGHNEKGHIKNGIKQMKASKRFFGEWGDLFFMAKKLLTGSFNQKNELEADYFGLDLTWKLGYDVCAIRTFWDEMAKDEERNKMFDFLRTHPYSDIRSSCLVNHIRSNFTIDCK
jgi:beta-barrel assembly-enhancing protease